MKSREAEFCKAGSGAAWVEERQRRQCIQPSRVREAIKPGKYGYGKVPFALPLHKDPAEEAAGRSKRHQAEHPGPPPPPPPPPRPTSKKPKRKPTHEEGARSQEKDPTGSGTHEKEKLPPVVHAAERHDSGYDSGHGGTVNNRGPEDTSQPVEKVDDLTISRPVETGTVTAARSEHDRGKAATVSSGDAKGPSAVGETHPETRPQEGKKLPEKSKGGSAAKAGIPPTSRSHHSGVGANSQGRVELRLSHRVLKNHKQTAKTPEPSARSRGPQSPSGQPRTRAHRQNEPRTGGSGSYGSWSTHSLFVDRPVAPPRGTEPDIWLLHRENPVQFHARGQGPPQAGPEVPQWNLYYPGTETFRCEGESKQYKACSQEIPCSACSEKEREGDECCACALRFQRFPFGALFRTTSVSEKEERERGDPVPEPKPLCRVVTRGNGPQRRFGIMNRRVRVSKLPVGLHLVPLQSVCAGSATDHLVVGIDAQPGLHDHRAVLDDVLAVLVWGGNGEEEEGGVVPPGFALGAVARLEGSRLLQVGTLRSLRHVVIRPQFAEAHHVAPLRAGAAVRRALRRVGNNAWRKETTSQRRDAAVTKANAKLGYSDPRSRLLTGLQGPVYQRFTLRQGPPLQARMSAGLVPAQFSWDSPLASLDRQTTERRWMPNQVRTQGPMSHASLVLGRWRMGQSLSFKKAPSLPTQRTRLNALSPREAERAFSALHRCAHLVVDVEVPLSGVLAHDPGFLQQEVGDLPSVGFPASTELDLERIQVKEMGVSPNYLALRSHNGKSIINGNWAVNPPGSYEAAGTVFVYSRPGNDKQEGESLTADGPTTEPIDVYVSTQLWREGEIGKSAFLCFWQSVYSCVSRVSQEEVEDDKCHLIPKPIVAEEVCNTEPCPAYWDVGEWSACSKSCGVGTQHRQVLCRQTYANRSTMVHPQRCGQLEKPNATQTCQVQVCSHWEIHTNWSSCSVLCGMGHRTRRVRCVGNDGAFLKESDCPIRHRPKTSEACDMGPCVRTWFYSEWSNACSAECGTGIQRRSVVCLSSDASGESQENCAGTKPADMRACNGGPCRRVNLWYTGPWSPCSSDCGTGTQRRDVVCLSKLGADYNVTEASECAHLEKPASLQPCHGTECEARWYNTAWSACSQSCMGGVQVREVQCLTPNRTLSRLCPPDLKPATKRPCNAQPCLPEIDENCKDIIQNCPVIMQARLCVYPYYKVICCASCAHALERHQVQPNR
nr:ADAMTS-like protein 4 [Anolis sagrei ordinatus]